MKTNPQSISILQRLGIGALALLLFAGPATVAGQSTVQIQLSNVDVRCAEQTIRLKHLAKIGSGSARLDNLANEIASVDIDSFDSNHNPVRVTKEQIRIRLILAGFKEHQFEIFGPMQVNASYVSHTRIRDSIESGLKQLLSTHYQIPPDDLAVILDRQFNDQLLAGRDITSIRLGRAQPLELLPGKQTISVVFGNGSELAMTAKIPVTVALVREFVVARQNISRGEVLSQENIQSVRRPVSDRNVRLASYDHAIGKQVQTDIPQYSMIKPNLISAGSRNSQFTIKKNSRINIIIRRGQLQLVMKAAKALDNGNPGDLITVVNPTTNQNIQATVIDAATVEVRY